MTMFSKHFINDPTQLVLSSLKAAKYANPSVALDEANKILYRKTPSPNTVALVSGGGAGHEPSFTSFVGEGILRAAVSGTIFASPSVKQIFNCITQLVGANKGVLLIVMNYTGDVLHFGLATEKARAHGLDAEMVVVGEDVGVGREKSGKVGRRGMAGTVLVQKIVGALAEMGASLSETSDLARLVAKNTVTLGSSLAHVHIPGTAEMDEGMMLKGSEVEVGMGIHNERGCKRMEIPNVSRLIVTMLKQLLDTRDHDRNYIDRKRDDEWVLMVNNLGGVSPLELGGVLAEVVDQLGADYKINPKRIYTGTFMTSLNGNGFSISLLRIADTGLGPGRDMLTLLDAAHETLGWTASIKPSTWHIEKSSVAPPLTNEEKIPTSTLQMDTTAFSHALSSGLRKLVAAEPTLTHYDTLVGDGDCGTGLKRGAEAVQSFIDSGRVSSDPVTTISQLATIVEESMDGTSGALTSIYLNALAKALRNSSPSAQKNVGLETWSCAAMDAMKELGRYTPAQPGDRTMIDALNPFLTTLAEEHDLKAAAQCARAGAERTRGMAPRLGRTVYIDKVGDIPDPGAVGIAVLVEGLAGI